MHSVADQLAEHKQRLAKRLRENTGKLSPDAANQMLARLEEFQFAVLGLIQCPECYVLRGRQVTMKGGLFQVGSGVEIFRCGVCKGDVRIPHSPKDLPPGASKI